MKNTSYASDLRTVNFSKMKGLGFKCPKYDKPSTNSFINIILVCKKHDDGVDVINGFWMPKNNYTEGDYYRYGGNNKPIKMELDNLYFWRSLNFLEVGEFI